MIVIACTLFGATLGVFLARKNKGNTLDMVQYAAASGIAFALLGLIVTVVISRIVVG